MKTNIKSKAFYAEAEDMSRGWGKYLRHIDLVKDAIAAGKKICLNDACGALYGEGVCYTSWEAFRKYCVKNGLGKKRLVWEVWRGMFDGWQKIVK